MKRPLGPPYLRRLEGSSSMEANRAVKGAFVTNTPLAPRKAPVPPVTARFQAEPAGTPGGVSPEVKPEIMIVPTGVPSLWRISTFMTATDPLATSAIPWPGVGLGPSMTNWPLEIQEPLAGLPFTDTMSATPMNGMKFLIFVLTMLGDVASLEGSARSPT